jgi:hypothetical protein
MKLALALGILMSWSAVAAASVKREGIGPEIIRFIDPETGVACYASRDMSVFSCVKYTEPKIDSKEEKDRR